MKYRIAVLVVISLGLLGVLHVARVSAQETEGEADVPNRCVLAQNYLKNIQKPRDLRGRVDRLQAYRYIYQRMTNFVVRLERNNQPKAADMRANIDRLASLIEQFKNSYEQYDTAREAVVKVKDCRENAETFISALNEARAARAKVAEDIELLQSVLSPNIKTDLENLHQQMLSSGQGGSQ
ncbi:MAG: hypothetical protein U0520_01980 [Candidatus Saccharimonadales bacterium]